MEQYINRFISNLEDLISQHDKEPDLLKRISKCLETIHSEIDSASFDYAIFFEMAVKHSKLTRIQAEILFNKVFMSQLLGKYIYYKNYFQLECYNRYATPEKKA